MASFSSVIPKTLRWEGGYTKDTGGRTMRGVTEKVWNKFKQDTGKYAGIDVKLITEDMAKEVYRRNYWDKIHGDSIRSQSAAAALFDFAVNSGVGQAVKTAQRVLNKMGHNLTVDGGIGPKTINAINAAGNSFTNNFVQARKDFYKMLVAKKPDIYGVYLKGWLKRADSFFFEEH